MCIRDRSREVGARGQFLEEPGNGFSFEAGNSASIEAAFKKIMDLPDAALVDMGEKSHALAATISPQTWVNSILKITRSSCTK